MKVFIDIIRTLIHRYNVTFVIANDIYLQRMIFHIKSTWIYKITMASFGNYPNTNHLNNMVHNIISFVFNFSSSHTHGCRNIHEQYSNISKNHQSTESLWDCKGVKLCYPFQITTTNHVTCKL